MAIFVTGVKADIVSTTGDITLLGVAPASVEQGMLESDTEIFLFSERNAVQLASEISAVIAAPGLSFTGTTIPTAGTIPTNTIVNSYFFHADKIGIADLVTVSGSVTFDTEILGVIVTTGNLTASDGSLGAPSTIYGSATDRGLENDTDLITISTDLRTLDIQLLHGTVEDHVRVITAVAPVTPGIDIEKLTNAAQADGADDPDVPRIAPGDPVTWTYEVTNTGGVAFSEAEVTVTDNQPGVTPVLDVASDNGDMLLAPGETWTYFASAQALDLSSPPGDVIVVMGCYNDQNTYENTGRVDITGFGIFDEDLSHYCNPTDIDADGVPDHVDNCILMSNTNQRDTNGDGFGNICDPDFNNDCVVNAADLPSMIIFFFTDDPDHDLNGDGIVNAIDLFIMKAFFFGPPGPSALASCP